MLFEAAKAIESLDVPEQNMKEAYRKYPRTRLPWRLNPTRAVRGVYLLGIVGWAGFIAYTMKDSIYSLLQRVI